MSSSDLMDWPIQSAQARDSLSSDDSDDLQSVQNFDTNLGQGQDLLPDTLVDSQSQSGDSEHLADASTHLNSDYSHASPPWPSKFNGPSSTWRSWTAGDRAIATSLDQLRATDLSVHLYNAYSLKQGATRLEATAGVDTEDIAEIWYPPKTWTAWPLPNEELHTSLVQSSEQRLSDEVYGTACANSKLSVNMVDSMNAVLLREAKQRLMRRNSLEVRQDSESPLRGVDISVSRTTRGKAGHENTEQPQDEMSIKKSNIQLENTYKVIPMADDEVAASILQPSVQHALTKLDDLFMGLHHSRHAYLSESDDGNHDMKTDVDEDESLNRGIAPQGNSRDRLRLKKRRLGKSISTTDSENESTLSSHKLKMPKRKRRERLISSKSRFRASRKRRAQLGLRDWGDILGMASLTGWDPSILARAASRCAILFGEKINFRTLPEGNDEATEITYPPVVLVESAAASNSNKSLYENNTKPEQVTETFSSREAKVIDGKLYCPFPKCTRSQKSFKRNWNFQQHMETMHTQEVFHNERDVVGAVHVDGFLCPIKAQRGWRSYAKSATTPRS